MNPRMLKPGQSCRVIVADLTGRTRVLLETTETLLEAPNWTLDGSALIVNGGGELWRLDVETKELARIPLDGGLDLNNDHVLSPNGTDVYVSANDGHIYWAALAGGAVQRVTDPADTMLHFLHGVSPDGEELAYVGAEFNRKKLEAEIFSIPAAGGRSKQLTQVGGHSDGCEYSPDGSWIYLNTEAFSTDAGHAQIARMRLDGSELEQLTFDRYVNWFPHWSPDHNHAVYLSYPQGTDGHPADLPVKIRIVSEESWTAPQATIDLFGGQGTINVNSWSPTSTEFAYVDYPMRIGEAE